MNVPQKFYDQYPELEETFIGITSILKAMEMCRIEKLYPNPSGSPLTPKTVFRFQVYLQVVLNRIYELSESIILCLDNSNIASAFILLRALDENSSVVFDGYRRLSVLLEQKDFQKIYELIFNLQYGTRLKQKLETLSDEQGEKDKDSYYTKEKVKEIYTARQILSVMDNVSKVIPNHRDDYEHLCEFAHPNYDGLMGLYCLWEDSYTVDLSKKSLSKQEHIELIFSKLHLFLRIFIEGYDAIVKQFPVITKLSIEADKSKGEETSA